MDEQALQRAAALVRAARRIVAVGHVAPDADAVGSALGFVVAARSSGRQAVATFGEPYELPDTLAHLPLDLVVPPGEVPWEPDLVVAFDTASADRLGSAAALVKRSGRLLVVDHHASNEGFGDVAVIDPAAGASAELAYEILQRVGWKIDEVAATCLYTGIVADTGRFQYSSTGPRTLRIAAELLEAGVRPDTIGQILYENVPYGYLALSSLVLGRAVLDPDHSLVWSVVYLGDLDRTGVSYTDSDPLIDDLRIAREAGAALLLKEVDEGFKGSLRSRGAIDVGAIAVALGGGGHHNASGFTHPGPPAAAVEAVAALIDV